MKNPRVSIFIVTVVFLAGLAACNTPSPTAVPTATSTLVIQATPTLTATPLPTATHALVQDTVRLWHGWDEAYVPVLVQILTGFQKQYPDVLFDVLYIPPENLQERYERALAEGAGPSILLGPAAWGAPLYQAGLAADLTGLVDGALLASLSPAARGNGEYQQAWVGLPYTLRGVVLYRNTRLVAQAADTLDELVMSAQAITQGAIIGADLERSFFFSGGHLAGLGGAWLSSDGQPAFVDENGAAWLDLVRNLSLAGPTEFLSDNDINLFKEGRVGYIIDGTWNLANLAEALQVENLAIDPWPAYQAGYLSGFVQADNLYLNPNLASQQKTAAVNFMNYFLSAAAQNELVKAGMIPAAANVNADGIELGPLLNDAMAALAGGNAYPLDPQFEAYTGPMDVVLKAALANKTPASEVLQSAAQAIEAALDAAQNPTP